MFVALFGAHEWYAEKPFIFRSLLDRFMIQIASRDPELLTSLGFLESMGIKGHNAELTDSSPEELDYLFNEIKKVRRSLLLYGVEDLDESERLSRSVALYLLDLAVEFEPFRRHNYPLNQMFGVQNGFPSFLDSQHRVETVEDAQNYISRLSLVKIKFEQTLRGLRIREEQGIIPPAFVIERVLKEMTDFVSTPTRENILFSSLQTKMKKSDDISEAQALELLARAEVEIETTVFDAYQLFIDYFTSLSGKAGTDDGFWRLPGGDAAYDLFLKFFTTSDMSADQIHALGLKEVDRIQAEIVSILGSEGFTVNEGFTAAIKTMSTNPEFYYADTDEGREQILADYQTILDEINSGMDSAFNVRPKSAMEVRRVPQFKEKTAPGAYYQRPALDGSRPGVFFANLYDINATPKYGMRTLAYHEGIPGHHFQVAISMELEGLPIFRTIPLFTAYTEGWALYAERLARDLGYQDDPFDNIGRLQAELFRAVRLVVDTGIHKKKWTRERAITYMLDNTGMAATEVVAEIERYIVMPGQATAYKMGMMKILELREKARAALGDKFDLKQFHDVVLKNGAVPMGILEQIVDDYIEKSLHEKS
ncbi:MAG: DUF885 domain-containing protein [Calditrichaeota bacterium]|nr:DUF885 domain-containing protein [Calditrichota bacterium]